MKIVDGVPELRQDETLSGEYDRPRKTRIDNAIRDLSPAAFKVWFVLGDFCREKAITHSRTVNGKREVLGHSEGCWPAVPTIAKKVGMSDRHVQNCIKELVKKGWIKKGQESKRSTNLYWLPRGFPSSRRWYAYAVMGDGAYPGEDD